MSEGINHTHRRGKKVFSRGAEAADGTFSRNGFSAEYNGPPVGVHAPKGAGNSVLTESCERNVTGFFDYRNTSIKTRSTWSAPAVPPATDYPDSPVRGETNTATVLVNNGKTVVNRPAGPAQWLVRLKRLKPAASLHLKVCMATPTPPKYGSNRSSIVWKDPSVN
jgi:hypothetical protein